MAIQHFGGLVQAWDADKLAVDLSPDCKNVKITPGGVSTREGLVSAFQSPTKGKITGLVGYTNDVSAVQMPLVMDSTGALYIESPAGSGQLSLVTRPTDQPAPAAGSYLQAATAFTRAYMAFGNLKTGMSSPGVFTGTQDRPIQVAAPFNNPVNPPASPVLSSTPGGALPAQNVYAVITYVGPGGETVASVQGSISMSASLLAVVPSPVAVPQVTGYNVYASHTSNVWLKQNANPIPIGTNWTEPTSGLTTTGALPPTASTITSVYATASVGTAPDIPTLTYAAGGTLGSRVYYIQVTYVINGVETPASTEATDIIPANELAVVFSPAASQNATGYNVYASTASGTEVLQNATPISIGTSWEEPTSGLLINTSPPPPVGPSGAIASGTRYGIVCYVLEDDTISPASPPFSYTASVSNQQVTVLNLPIGTVSIKKRLIAFTVAGASPAGPYLYIETTTESGGVNNTTTIVPDNTTTSATFNFSDTFLAGSTDITDSLTRITLPNLASVAFSPSTRRLLWWGDAANPSVIYCSEPDDPGNYQGDTGLVIVAENDGQPITAAFEVNGDLYCAKSDSLYFVQPTNDVPSTWVVSQRAVDIGICGPRAFDVSNDGIVFVHRSGVYLMTGGTPDLLSTELNGPSPDRPGIWQQINWTHQEKIWVSIDTIQKEVRIGVPTGQSVECDTILKFNYVDGFDPSYGYSPYTQKFHWRPGRRWSIDTIAATTAVRIDRPLALGGMTADTQQAVSQILLGSATYDGNVCRISPDAHDDNGQAIYPCYYLTGTMNSLEQQQQMKQGVDLLAVVQVAARGYGVMNVSGLNESGRELLAAPIALTGTPTGDVMRWIRIKGERTQVRFASPKSPNSYWSLGMAYAFLDHRYDTRP